jgi:thioester reductase-like protein
LSEFHWDYLAGRIDSVFHFAAEVNLVLPYEKLREVNIDSTRELLKFCVTKTRKFLHYASTLSVFVSSDDPRKIFYEDDRLDSMKEVYGGYAQTKWVGEKLLFNAKKQGFDSLFIYRFGLITGESTLGFGKANDFFAQFLKNILTLKTLPAVNGMEMKVDITPVDFAAKACIAIAQIADSNIFHIANPDPLALSDLTFILKNMGISIAESTLEEFFKKCKSISSEESYFYLSLSRLFLDTGVFNFVRPLDLFQASGIEFDFKNTKKIFLSYDANFPPPDAKLIGKYIYQVTKEF